MLKKILSVFVAIIAAMLLAAPSANASTWSWGTGAPEGMVPANHIFNNRVNYAGGGPVTCGSSNYIYLDVQHPYANYDYVIRPCESSYPTLSTVSCFIPSRNLYSYWNGVYYANNPRCFTTSNNNLTLYAYMH